jgi:TolB-like protein/Tfp pilus assembly protein PilF
VLVKEPSVRIDARRMVELLREPAPPPIAVPSASSVAVLPFVHLSSDPDTEYFSDGVAEEILNALTRMGLHVAARTSSFSFKGQERDVREIGSRLGVRHLLQGSVRRAGTRVRISTQLIDAATGFERWSETFDRELPDIFAIQDEVAQAVATRLSRHLGQLAPAGRHAPPIEAFEAYLRGLDSWNRGTPDSIRDALRWYQRAITLDPDYADAHAAIGNLLAYQSFAFPGGTAAAEARAAVERALKADPRNPLALGARAFIAFWLDWNFVEAERAIRTAIDANPNAAGVHETYAALLANLGRHDEASREMHRALELDPLSISPQLTAQWVLIAGGKYRDALDRGRAVLDGAPRSHLALIGAGWAYVQLDALEEARSVYRTILEDSPNDPSALGGMAVAEARAGNVDEARGWVARAIEAPRKSHTFITWAYAALGQRDDAFTALKHAIDAREPSATCMPVFAWWDPLRGDDRFLEALRGAGYPQSSWRRTFEARAEARVRDRQRNPNDVIPADRRS